MLDENKFTKLTRPFVTPQSIAVENLFSILDNFKKIKTDVLNFIASKEFPLYEKQKIENIISKMKNETI